MNRPLGPKPVPLAMADDVLSPMNPSLSERHPSGPWPIPNRPETEPKTRAFTLIELLIVVAIIGIMAGLLLPALSGAKARARQVKCLNNLRQTSLGLRLWAHDNGEKYPWQIAATAGGSAGSADWGDNFRACSNELSTPHILLCPTDKTRKAASNWVSMAADVSVSFLVGTNATESLPALILLGDRNVSGGGGGLDPSWSSFLGSSIDAAWDKELHVRAGNLAMADGSVQATKTPLLREIIAAEIASGISNVVLSKPRGIF